MNDDGNNTYVIDRNVSYLSIIQNIASILFISKK